MRAAWFLVPQLSVVAFLFERKQQGLEGSPIPSSIGAKEFPARSSVGFMESPIRSAKDVQAMSPATAPMAFVEGTKATRVPNYCYSGQFDVPVNMTCTLGETIKQWSRSWKTLDSTIDFDTFNSEFRSILNVLSFNLWYAYDRAFGDLFEEVRKQKQDLRCGDEAILKNYPDWESWQGTQYGDEARKKMLESKNPCTVNKFIDETHGRLMRYIAILVARVSLGQNSRLALNRFAQQTAANFKTNFLNKVGVADYEMELALAVKKLPGSKEFRCFKNGADAFTMNGGSMKHAQGENALQALATLPRDSGWNLCISSPTQRQQMMQALPWPPMNNVEHIVAWCNKAMRDYVERIQWDRRVDDFARTALIDDMKNYCKEEVNRLTREVNRFDGSSFERNAEVKLETLIATSLAKTALANGGGKQQPQQSQNWNTLQQDEPVEPNKRENKTNAAPELGPRNPNGTDSSRQKAPATNMSPPQQNKPSQNIMTPSHIDQPPIRQQQKTQNRLGPITCWKGQKWFRHSNADTGWVISMSQGGFQCFYDLSPRQSFVEMPTEQPALISAERHPISIDTEQQPPNRSVIRNFLRGSFLSRVSEGGEASL